MSTCGACGQDLDPRNDTGFCFNSDMCKYRVQNKQPPLGQPRFDWEAEEQRTNDLEDLVLQLVERVEKLESGKPDMPEPEKDQWLLASYTDMTCVHLESYSGGGAKEGAWGRLTLRFTDENTGEIKLRDYKPCGDFYEYEIKETDPGFQIAKAIKAME